MPPITLTLASDLMPQAQRVLARVTPQLRRLLPDAEVDHIGATAIPDALTKGDIDLVVRVATPMFKAAVEILSAHFEIKQRENWTPDFASFGDDTGYDLPLGIQLVAKKASVDFLTFLRDNLISNPAALAEYNRLKVHHAEDGADGYWQAKHAFISRILAAHNRE